jgi:hypothetical protein
MEDSHFLGGAIRVHKGMLRMAGRMILLATVSYYSASMSNIRIIGNHMTSE